MKWVEPQAYQPSAEIQDIFSGSLILTGQLAKRGFTTLAQARRFLEIEAYSPSSPFEFPDMGKAVARLKKAIHAQELIGIWGDFDADGQTSTALLVSGLREAGARVAYHVPVRADESHGIGLEFLKGFITEGIKLLVTCDTGITEFESMEYLQCIGMDVILTDHHTFAETLPPALSIINPRLLPGSHPMSGLAGVGTAYQVVRGLFEDLGKQALADQYLDLVALGTVADLAELTGENRYYTRLGLEQLNQSTRPSITAMLEFAGFKKQRITESHIGYTFAPRMNAPGRLADANPMVEFLVSFDQDFIRKTAIQIEELNAHRKLAVDMVHRSALDLLDQQPALLQYPVILLAKSGWEGGVVGIAASRVVEKFGKPAILMNIRGEVAGGSARSVEGIDIIQAIRENADTLIRFGGHPMAAGMSIRVEDIPQFRESLSASVDRQSAGLVAEPQIEIDAYLPFSSLEPALLEDIDLLAPFGPGNLPPLLVSRGVEVTKNTLIGKSRDHRRLSLKDQGGSQVDALWWNSSDAPMPESRFDLAYYARRDSYKGGDGIILEWFDFREIEQDTIEIRTARTRYRVSDHRFDPNADVAIDIVKKENDIVLWAEGSRHQQNDAFDRARLKTALKLAILTPPPSLPVLRSAIESVSPSEVLLFSLPASDDSLKKFLESVSHKLRSEMLQAESSISMIVLAALLGQTEETVLAGLRWWQLHGDIDFKQEGGQVQVVRVRGKVSQELIPHTLYLQKLMIETAAFRNYYLRADPLILLS